MTEVPVGETNQTANRLIWVGLFSMGILIVLYGMVGTYMRPVLDDYCLAARIEEVGIIGTVSFQYWNWSGNVIGLYYQVAGAAFELYAISPLALMTLWIATFSWVLWECLSLSALPRHRPLIVLIAMVMTLGLFDMTPNIGQTLYWLNGTANYGPTSALFIMFLTLLVRITRLGAKRLHYIATVFLIFVAVLGQITMVIYCIGLLMPLLFAVYLYRNLQNRGDLIHVLSIALVTGGLGALIVIATPGNEVREASLASAGLIRLGLGEAIIRTGLFATIMVIGSILYYAPLVHLVLFTISHVVGRRYRPPVLDGRQLPRWLRFCLPFAAILVGLFVFYLGAFASTYTLGNPGPPRAWVVPQSLWIIVVLVTGYLHGVSFPPVSSPNSRWSRIAFTGLIVAFILIELAHLVDFVPAYRDFADDFDARIALIEEALNRGESSITVPPYRTPLNRLMLLSNEDELLCLRIYYGLESLTTD
jgi:hypothetical protein